MPERKPLTAERLRELLHYDPETGIFVRLVDVRCGKGKGRVSVAKGSIAGCVDAHGYLLIRLDNHLYRAHRLAWLFVFGEWPTRHIDHINGERKDNRISNLRDVTVSVNLQNQRRAPAGSRSGLLGAQWDKQTKRWRSSVKTNGRKQNIGRFDTPEAAHEAYLAAKRKLHEGCTI
jgi:hypothetical protein